MKNKRKEKILNEIKKFDDEYYIKRNYAIEYPEINITIDRDKMKIKISSDEYIFFQARGHNHDGIITLNKTKGILIAGDYLSNIEFPYVYDSFKKYKKTLKKFSKIVATRSVKILVTGHGDFTKDKKEMKQRILDSKTYLKEIEKEVKNNVTFNLQKLFSKYDFPIGMLNFHKQNLKLLKKEISG